MLGIQSLGVERFGMLHEKVWSLGFQGFVVGAGGLEFRVLS